jgi:hypothetical protein
MRARRPLVAVLLALTLLAAVSCGGADDSEDEAEPTATTQADAAATTGGGTAAGRVTVEDAGREPRQRLQLRLAAGSTTRAAMVSRTALEVTMEGSRVLPGALPTLRTVVEQRIDTVDSEGRAHYTATFTDWSVLPTADVDSRLSDQLQQVLNQFKGLRATGSVDASGGRRTFSIDTGGIADPLLKSRLDSISSEFGNLGVPFPSEPVGPGARWRVGRAATFSGITVNMTTTYTLRMLTADRYELDLVEGMEAPPGTAMNSSGVEATIERFSVRSTGNVVGELTRDLPSRKTVHGGGELTIVNKERGETLSGRITQDLELSPA